MAVELNSSAIKGSVAFTGRLACMTRADAFEVVRQHGGALAKPLPSEQTCSSSVNSVGLCWMMVGRPTSSPSRSDSTLSKPTEPTQRARNECITVYQNFLPQIQK